MHKDKQTGAAQRKSRSLRPVFSVVGFGSVDSVTFGAAMLSRMGLNSFQGLVGQFSGVGWVALILSLDSSEDSLALGANGFIGTLLRGDQPGGRLNLVAV